MNNSASKSWQQIIQKTTKMEIVFFIHLNEETLNTYHAHEGYFKHFKHCKNKSLNLSCMNFPINHL